MGMGKTPALAVTAALLAVAGCKSPFSKDDGDDILIRRVAGAIDRELAAVPPDRQQLLETTQPDSILHHEPSLGQRMDELKRAGYVVGPSNADLSDAMDADEKKYNSGGTIGGLEGEALARQCFEEARAEGFKLDEDE